MPPMSRASWWAPHNINPQKNANLYGGNGTVFYGIYDNGNMPGKCNAYSTPWYGRPNDAGVLMRSAPLLLHPGGE